MGGCFWDGAIPMACGWAVWLSLSGFWDPAWAIDVRGFADRSEASGHWVSDSQVQPIKVRRLGVWAGPGPL